MAKFYWAISGVTKHWFNADSERGAVDFALHAASKQLSPGEKCGMVVARQDSTVVAMTTAEGVAQC